jgi:hypothetical protein
VGQRVQSAHFEAIAAGFERFDHQQDLILTVRRGRGVVWARYGTIRPRDDMPPFRDCL